MPMTKRLVSRLAIISSIAIAIPATGQTGPDKRLGTWQNQLVLPQKVSARLAWAQRHLRPSGIAKLEKMGGTLAPDIAAGSDLDPLRGRAEVEVSRSFPGLAAMDVSEAAYIVLSMAVKDMDDDIRTIMAEIRAMNAAKQKLREWIKELNGWISQEMSKVAGSPDIKNETVTGQGTTARAARPAAKAIPPPVGRLTFETRRSPVIHFEYVKTPAVPPLPPYRPGLPVSGLKSLLDDFKGDLDRMNEMSEMTSLRLQMTMDRRSKFIQTLSNIMKKMSTTQESLVQNIK